MTPERQRIAIAEACGWTISDGIGDWISPIDGCAYCDNAIPDYLNDLNAMHEAEGTMELQTSGRYAEWLTDVVKNKTGLPWVDAGSFAHIHATAAQRAEAFLRTIGKWEGE